MNQQYHCSESYVVYCPMYFSCLPDPTAGVTVTPTSGAAMFRKDSTAHSGPHSNPHSPPGGSSSPLGVPRPSSLQVASPPSGTPPSSDPIPVPTQVAAYKRMCSSPSSPQAPAAHGGVVKVLCEQGSLRKVSLGEYLSLFKLQVHCITLP